MKLILILLLLATNAFAQSSAIPGIGGGSGGGLPGTNSFIVHTPIGTQCNADPCTIEQQFSSDGLHNAVTSISRTGTGTYTLNVKSGFCSVEPMCVLTSGRPGNQRQDSGGSATAVQVAQFNSGGGAEDTQGLTAYCVCND